MRTRHEAQERAIAQPELGHARHIELGRLCKYRSIERCTARLVLDIEDELDANHEPGSFRASIGTRG